jgi:hypothetical protein
MFLGKSVPMSPASVSPVLRQLLQGANACLLKPSQSSRNICATFGCWDCCYVPDLSRPKQSVFFQDDVAAIQIFNQPASDFWH